MDNHPKISLAALLLVTVGIVFAAAGTGVIGGCGGSDKNGDGKEGTGTLSETPEGFLFTDDSGNEITSFSSGATVQLRDKSGNTVLGFTPSGSVNFANVVAARSETMALVHFPSSADKSGISGTVTLYIPCGTDDDSVLVCHAAESLDEIATDCEGVLTLTTSTPTSGNYTWANTDRSGTTDCQVTADVANFGTGATGQASGGDTEGSDGHGGGTPSSTLSSIAVTPADPRIALGTTQQFTATGTFSDGTTQNLTTQVSWSSSSTSVATVNATSGLATTVAAGSTTVTAASGSISGSTALTVTTATLSSLAVSPNSASVATLLTQQFTTTGTYTDASTQNLTSTATWSSSNTALATIDTAGLATAVAVGGPVTITATSGGISGSTTLTVTTATFTSLQTKFFSAEAATCTKGGCHGSSSISLTYSNLVNVSSAQCSSPCKRVVPNDTANSWLVTRITGGGGFTRMPAGGGTPLTTEQIQAIKDWINAGGLNN